MSPEVRSRLLIPMIVGCLATMVWMGRLGAPLDVDWSGQGILALEFCWWGDRCGDLIASWPSPDAAWPSLYGDYLFMAAYGATVSLACIQAIPVVPRSLARFGEPLAWAAVVAALCDAVENVALIRLVGGATGPESAIAFGFASVKFALIAAGLAYALVGGVAWLRR